MKIIALTIGDPGGIGPEITAKLLRYMQHAQDSALSFDAWRLQILGDIRHLRETAQSFGMDLPSESQTLAYHDIPLKHPGQVAYQAIVQAVERIAAKKAHMLVTGPISKENLHHAGIQYSGHTEILQDLANRHYPVKSPPTSFQGGTSLSGVMPDSSVATPEEGHQSDMIFVHESFRMLLLTRHIPLSHVSSHLTIPGVRRSLENLIRFLRDHAGIARPRVCVLGVNPHAGEIGGHEEKEILQPAMRQLSEQYPVSFSGPLPADAVFRGFHPNNIPYDAYVAAYHDQGLIPFKLIAGMQAVNVTIGLPFLRTSVSHGTAQDIAGQGIADPGSLIQAVRVALQLSNRE